MDKYHRRQEEITDGYLRGTLNYAERQQMIVGLFDHYKSKLDNYRKSKEDLNRFCDWVAKIQIDGMFNEARKEMALKIIKIFTEIIKLQGERLLNDFILN